MNAPQDTDDFRFRQAIRDAIRADETATVRRLIELADLSSEDRVQISARAAADIRQVRSSPRHGLMETFLAQYGLSTDEGVALMCLAEALLRVPDRETIDALIQDKIAGANWARHLGRSSSTLVNASTWALMLTGKILRQDADEDLVDVLRGVVRRVGEPVIRQAVAQAMRELGQQFVLGRTIDEAIDRGRDWREKGYLYSYDMLGEAAHTEADAARYHLSYSHAISVLAGHATSDDITKNPGISVKLSALHPRYETAQRDRVMAELMPRVRSLALLAKSANMGLTIDAEEAERLDLSLDIIEAVLSEPGLEGWDGFGVVVQAYGQRAASVLDWLTDLSGRLDRRIMVRLVKGAYWDTEIKRAQVLGLDGYPVFTSKSNTDVSYLACVRRLLDASDRLFPQFATHNAHTLAAVLHMADEAAVFELQRLHGMGEELHEVIRQRSKVTTRIYAPVGAHRDLLAYLVRRLLENGANSSFVNQIVDETIGADVIAADPIAIVEGRGEELAHPNIPQPLAIYEPRTNSRGLDFTDPATVDWLESARASYRRHQWSAGSKTAEQADDVTHKIPRVIRNPADATDVVGTCVDADQDDFEAAYQSAQKGFERWSRVSINERAEILESIAALYEEAMPEFIALATREAGKTPPDGVAEVREAVDFCRYYAAEARSLTGTGRGVFVCISPWNFPLAIFTGQIVAALAAGNAVLAKPAEQTPLIADLAVGLMHRAGIPRDVLRLLPGDGPTIGQALVSDPRCAGVCFTGSTETARLINRAMAATGRPEAPLIAETGGLNAMIVDSTALPEQAVQDIIASAFQSAGQRCSALRVLYVQSDVHDRVVEMLRGAMRELSIGNPWSIATDVGPVIDQEAKDTIEAHCAEMEAKGRLIERAPVPEGLTGNFLPPVAYRISGIDELHEEVFGPVLHVASFEADELDAVIDAINATGYGLTFGLHTRIEARIQHMVDRVDAGNQYVNRNQIGAVVGSQPFGGEGLSGTGPKAGGPNYLPRFQAAGEPWGEAGTSLADAPLADEGEIAAALAALSASQGPSFDLAKVREMLDAPDPVAEFAGGMADAELIPSVSTLKLPGPTGESNQLSTSPKGIFVCLGVPSAKWSGAAYAQVATVLATGNRALVIGPETGSIERTFEGASYAVFCVKGHCAPEMLAKMDGISGVLAAGDEAYLREFRAALASRPGEVLPLIAGTGDLAMLVNERSLCVDTTASGGNANLLAAVSD